MAREKVIPTMSVVGYVTNPMNRLDYLLAYWLTTHFHQSYTARTTLHSFQYLIQQYDGEPDRLAAAVSRDLTEYLTPHFDSAECTALAKYPKGRANTKFYHLSIGLTVTQDGIGYDIVSKFLEVNDGKFREITGKL